MNSFETPDRAWRVDVINLDGRERYRVRHHGYFRCEARTVAELQARGVPVNELEEIGR
jgi:hypothetical protein